MNDIQDQLKKIPTDPGVYLFKDNSGKIIYIGKAINLKSRVRSYWNRSSWSDRPKLGILVPKVCDIETIITKSEKEALILEANLVFRHQPRYNVLLKDNKTFPWLVITYDDIYPRLLPVRSIDKFKKRCGSNSKNKYFGPYTNVSAMYENLSLVNELFPLRKKRVPPFKDRPCLNYDMGKCLGPCQGLVSPEEYRTMLMQVEMLLKGSHSDLKAILKEEMQRASDSLEYEKAAKFRDRLKALETFNEVQNVMSDKVDLDQDVFALVFDADHELCILQVFKIRKGKLVNRETHDIEFNSEDEREIFYTAFTQYYTQVPDTEIPKEILVSHVLLTDHAAIEIKDERMAEDEFELDENRLKDNAVSDWLSERKANKVSIIKPQRGEKYAQLQLAKRNARVIIEKMKLELLEDASKDINVALENIQKELDLPTLPERIECFDISHMQGTDTVASMVCFIDGMPAKDQYRRFKISKDQNNDFDSMKEAVTRRYKKNVNNPDEASPQLIIIDGGKGQLNAALEAVKELELSHLKLVGIAKKEEEIYLPGQSRPIAFDRKSPELFLVQRVRNEAHRFAVNYHRRLRSKRSIQSVISTIPGIGPKKKELLLKEFGSLSKIKAASTEALAALPGFSEKLALSIKEYLND